MPSIFIATHLGETMASGGTLKVVVSAITGNAVITLGKFAGFFVSASPSMLAEAIHSLADTLNQVLLFIGIKQSQHEASTQHPLGYGSATYLWNLISAVGIFFLGFGVTAYHGIHSLIHPPENINHSINWIAIGVLLFAFVIESYVLVQAYKEVNQKRKGQNWISFFNQSDDPTAIAILFEDGIAVLGVALAFIGMMLTYFFKNPSFDAITSIIIALLLGLMAIFLGIANGRFLIGRAMTDSSQEEMKNFIENLEIVDHVERILTRVIGPSNVRLSLEVSLNGSLLIDRKKISLDAQEIKSHPEQATGILVDTFDRAIRTTGNAINELEKQIQTRFPEVKFIDLELH